MNVDQGKTEFICPKARILVAGSIASDIKAAERLLSPYHAVIDVCLNGAAAIRLVKHRQYDIVFCFMDHMMPETVQLLRGLDGDRFKTMPIIALTADTPPAEKREMFIQKGFTDFLAKPVEAGKLCEILSVWIPKEKKKYKIKKTEHKPENVTGIIIPGVDVNEGILMTGGTEALYKQILSIFYKDAQEHLSFLQGTPQIDDVKLFVVHVHSLKSTSAVLGAKDFSREAADLEAAGDRGDIDYCRKKLPEFTKKLIEIKENIRRVLEADDYA